MKGAEAKAIGVPGGKAAVNRERQDETCHGED